MIRVDMIGAIFCSVLWSLSDLSRLHLQRGNLGEHLYYKAAQNPVYLFRNVHLNTVGNIKAPLMFYVHPAQQFSEMTTRTLGTPESDPSETALVDKKGAYLRLHGMTSVSAGPLHHTERNMLIV